MKYENDWYLVKGYDCHVENYNFCWATDSKHEKRFYAYTYNDNLKALERIITPLSFDKFKRGLYTGHIVLR